MNKAKLFLLSLAVGASPVWAQTAANNPGVTTDQTAAELPDVPAAHQSANVTEAKTSLYDFSLMAAAESKPRALDFTGVTGRVQAVGAAQPQTSEPATASTAADPLTWHGITLYGAYDIGVGWVSHGLPENGYNYEGASLVNRNGYEHRFLIAPNNLQQTGFGVRGKIEFQPGWYAVFNGSTGINPQSGLLANASKTDIVNNGLPRKSYSYAIDGARAGTALQ